MSEFYVFAVLWNCQLLYQQYVSIITDLIIDSKRCTCVIFLQLSAFTHNSMEHAKPFLHFDIISLIIYVNKECYFAANICTTIPIWDTDTFFLQTHSLFFKHFKKWLFLTGEQLGKRDYNIESHIKLGYLKINIHIYASVYIFRSTISPALNGQNINYFIIFMHAWPFEFQ